MCVTEMLEQKSYELLEKSKNWIRYRTRQVANRTLQIIMIDINELRLGSLVQYNGEIARVVSLGEGRVRIHHRIDEETLEAISLNADSDELEELPITDELLAIINCANMGEGYNLPNANATRMLCEGAEGYYISMSNTDKKYPPIHITPEFTGYHSLQNAYHVIYGKDMPDFMDKIWMRMYR